MYAILSHGGRQYRVSAGDRLVVDRLEAEVGSVVALAPLLLTGGDGTTAVGADLDGMRVAVTVVAHRRGEKLRIFKYKAKKRSRKVAGYRSDLTELRVESILAKGAALPRSSTTAPADAPRRAQRSTAAPTAEAEPSATAQRAKPSATAATRTRAAAGTAKRASSPASKPKAAGGAVKSETKAAATPKKPAAKTKAAPKRATRGASAARDKEKGDGA